MGHRSIFFTSETEFILLYQDFNPTPSSPQTQHYGPAKINSETGSIVWSKVITDQDKFYTYYTTGEFIYSKARSEMTSEIKINLNKGFIIITFSTNTGDFV
jgi:hypothetical protein